MCLAPAVIEAAQGTVAGGTACQAAKRVARRRCPPLPLALVLVETRLHALKRRHVDQGMIVPAAHPLRSVLDVLAPDLGVRLLVVDVDTGFLDRRVTMKAPVTRGRGLGFPVTGMRLKTWGS